MEMLLHVVLVFLVPEVWSQDEGLRVKSFRLGEDVNLTCEDRPHSGDYFYSIWTITRQGKNCSIRSNFTSDYANTCMDHNKDLKITNHTSTLHIHNFSLNDVGIYNCDSAYNGGVDKAIYTLTIIAPPEVSSWVEWRGGRRVAVCRAEGASPAANVSWLITGNATTKRSESDGLITMETTVELPTPEQAQNISCTVTHPYWDEPHVIRPDFSPRQAMSQNRTAVYATIAISVVFCLAMLVLGIKKVTHLRCLCGNCTSLSPEENVCCRETPKVMHRCQQVGVNTCITEHPGFEAVALNPYVLQAVYGTYLQLFGDMPETMVHRMNQNSSKSPSVEEVEEVEPYESYVQRVNSIYNSSRDLFA